MAILGLDGTPIKYPAFRCAIDVQGEIAAIFMSTDANIPDQRAPTGCFWVDIAVEDFHRIKADPHSFTLEAGARVATVKAKQTLTLSVNRHRFKADGVDAAKLTWDTTEPVTIWANNASLDGAYTSPDTYQPPKDEKTGLPRVGPVVLWIRDVRHVSNRVTVVFVDPAEAV